MAIELQTFASGDTDYIPKMNGNVLTLTTVITQLQTQLEAIAATSPLSVGMFLDTLFNRADALIGPESYAPTLSGSTLIVAPGGMYLAEDRTTVATYTDTSLSFLGRAADTYYIVVIGGQPGIRDAFLAGTIYSVEWTGTTFGEIAYLVPIFYDTKESDASRKSLALTDSPPTQMRFMSLDGRLEAAELLAKEARDNAGEGSAVADDALEAAENAQNTADAAWAEATRPVFRKVGATVDGTVGVKGAIQVDFEGTIIGWSCIADAVGSLAVEVSVKASPDPPGVPAIPDPVVDKITAAAPIALTAAQSASSDTAGVVTWITSVPKWSVVQFKVASATSITRATLYVLIQETPASPVDSPPSGSPFEVSELEFREGGQ